MDALLILGNTYKERHRIRQAGGVYSHDIGGHVIPLSATASLSDIIEKQGSEVVEVAEGFFKPLEGEALRQYRTERNIRRADRLDARAESARKEAAKRDLKPHERDFLSLCEPVKVGHHSERRHRKLLERAGKSFEARMTLQSKASRLESIAESLRAAPARIKGDAARADEKRRNWHRQNTRVCTQVSHGGRTYEVLKVNKVTFRLKGHFSDFNTPMELCEPITNEKQDA
jgi:hypothetical protein